MFKGGPIIDYKTSCDFRDNKKWGEMYELNQENIVFGQFDWNDGFPEGRLIEKSRKVNRSQIMKSLK